MVLHPQYDCTDQGQPRLRLPNTDGICIVASLAGWSRIYSKVTVSFECQYGSCAILYLSRVSVRCQKLGVAFGYLICGARNKHLCGPHDAVLCSVWSCPIHFFSTKLPPTLTASKWRGEGEAFQDSLSWSFIRIWISSWRALVSLFRDPSRRGQGPVSHR